MKNKSSKKTWIISAGIILAAILAYYAFFAGAPAVTDVGTLEAQSNGQVVGAQVLSLLNQIQSLQIDKNFFQTPAYLSLQDHTVAIPPVIVGRPNPFAPLPGIKLTK
jgi:hypothetical protein